MIVLAPARSHAGRHSMLFYRPHQGRGYIPKAAFFAVSSSSGVGGTFGCFCISLILSSTISAAGRHTATGARGAAEVPAMPHMVDALQARRSQQGCYSLLPSIDASRMVHCVRVRVAWHVQCWPACPSAELLCWPCRTTRWSAAGASASRPLPSSMILPVGGSGSGAATLGGLSSAAAVVAEVPRLNACSVCGSVRATCCCSALRFLQRWTTMRTRMTMR